MPRYDYDCARCGVFEAYQPILAEKLEHCPVCYGKVDRLICMPSMVEANTRGSAVKKMKDIINHVDKSGLHGSHPNMKQAMCDYGAVAKKAKITGSTPVLQR